MIDTLSPHRARGRIGIPTTAGSLQAGYPISEPGHITPRFPDGITNLALSVATPEIQRETALCWFLMNLRVFDRTKGGPWFDYANPDGTARVNSAGYGTGRYAPPQYTSISVLTAEFGGTLPDPLLAELAVGLPSMWEWIDPPPRADHQPEDLLQAIWDELAPILFTL